MATAPRHASLSSVPSDRDFPSPPHDDEQATVEESPDELDLVSILREAAISGSRPLESIAEAVADAARVLSGADGTALGLETRGMITCRARSGNIAPPLGAPISSESGISGECLRLGTMLVCHDAMIDPRVDTEVCRSLGIRSVAAVPVRGPMGVAGILEAFSGRLNAFDGQALTSLRELAEIAETAYLREAPGYTPAVQRPAAVTRSAAYATPQGATEDILDEMSEPTRKNRLWVVGGIALALLLTVAVAWWSWQAPADEGSGSGQSVRAASPEPAHSEPLREALPKPGPGLPASRSGRSRSQVVQNAADLKPIQVKPDPTPTIISLAPESTRTPTTRQPDMDASVVDPPSVELAPSASSEELARLTSVQTQLPSVGPRVSEGVVEPTLIRKVAPTYPMQARNEKLSGTVVLSAQIATDGAVREISVVSGPPILAHAAEMAVQQWRYRPGTLNGSPVPIQKQITFVFTLP